MYALKRVEATWLAGFEEAVDRRNNDLDEENANDNIMYWIGTMLSGRGSMTIAMIESVEYKQTQRVKIRSNFN